jgi:ATP-dependent Zn protease
MASLARELRAPLVATSVGTWLGGVERGTLDAVIRAARESHGLAARHAAASGVAIWFVDEIDALPDRATLDARNRDWWTPVVTETLTLLDGALAAPGVIVVGATNHPSRLDAALVRPGRLSRTIWIDPPDEAAVPGILRLHLGSDLPEADLTALAGLGLGRTGAALQAAVVQARAMARRERRPLTVADLAGALAPTDPRSPADRWRAAVHEAGHTLAALALGREVARVSILPEGAAGGMTVMVKPTTVPTRPVIEDDVVVLLAGRAAEETCLGWVSAGSAGDLREATTHLLEAYVRFGLGDRLRAMPADLPMLALDPGLARAVEEDLASLYARALSIVRATRYDLGRLAEALMARRVLSGPELAAVLATPQAGVPEGV